MDFGALPPEINSARMYSGAGVAPMLGAAVAWNELAGELHDAAQSYHSVVTGLTGATWSGPASIAMTGAAARYVAWMSATAVQAEQTGAQVAALAGAYQSAFAATVPPPVIAANRSLLAALVATNILGQNTPAIAATEALYAEMWAQDAAAMYSYADASSVAAAVTPFSTPPQTTTDDGLAQQSAAVGQAAGTNTSQQALAASLSQLWDDLTTNNPQIEKNLVGVEQIVRYVVSTIANATGAVKTVLPTAAGASTGGAAALAVAPGSTGLWGMAAVPRGAPIAGSGGAGAIGRLSVPASWVGAAQPAQAPPPLHLNGAGVAPDQPAGLLRGIPAGAAGRRGDGYVNRYGFRRTMVLRPPDAG